MGRRRDQRRWRLAWRPVAAGIIRCKGAAVAFHFGRRIPFQGNSAATARRYAEGAPSLRSSVRQNCWIAIALAFPATLLAGCPSTPTVSDASQDAAPIVLREGANRVEIGAGKSNVFVINTPSERDLVVRALPHVAAALGVGLIEAPDGESFTAAPGASEQSNDERFNVAPSGSAGGGIGFVLEVGGAEGEWRLEVAARRSSEIEGLERAVKRASILENVVLYSYLLLGGPALDPLTQSLLDRSYPQLQEIQKAISVTIEVEFAAADEPANDDAGDDDGSNDGGGDDNPPDDNGDGGGDDGNDDGGTDDDDGAGDTPLPPPADPNDAGAGDIDDLPPTDDGDGGADDDAGEEPPAPTAVIALEEVVASGDSVPGQLLARFTYFGNPVLDDAGRIAFYASYSGGGGSAGLYVWHEGVLRSILDNDPTKPGVPGLTATDRFSGFGVQWDVGSPHLSWGKDGRLLFATSVNNSPQPNALMQWRATDGQVTMVVSCPRFADTFPNATDDFICEFYHPGLADDGAVVFGNRYSFFKTDGTFSFFNLGLFTVDADGAISRLARGVPPGQPAAARFNTTPLLLTTMNGAGDYLFQAGYNLGEGTRGVYLSRNGNLFRVIDNGPDRGFPGLPAGATVNAGDTVIPALALGPTGTIALDTTLTIAGAPREAVLLWDGERFYDLGAPDGSPATALLTGVNDDGHCAYLAGGAPFLSDGTARVGLAAQLPAGLLGRAIEWQGFGGAINNNGVVALRFRDTQRNSFGLAYWTGASLLLAVDLDAPLGGLRFDRLLGTAPASPLDVDRVGTLSGRPEVDRPGRSGALNDGNEMVFRVGALGADARENTRDDTQAIYIARPQ